MVLIVQHRCRLRFPFEFISTCFNSLAGLWRNLNCEQLLLLLLFRRKRQMSNVSPRARRSVTPSWKTFQKVFFDFFHCTRSFQDTSKSAPHRHPKNLCVVCGAINGAAGFSYRATDRGNKWFGEGSHATVRKELQGGSRTRASPLENSKLMCTHSITSTVCMVMFLRALLMDNN